MQWVCPACVVGVSCMCVVGVSCMCVVGEFRRTSVVYCTEYENVLMQKLVISCDEEGGRVNHDTCVAEHSNNHSLCEL